MFVTVSWTNRGSCGAWAESRGIDSSFHSMPSEHREESMYNPGYRRMRVRLVKFCTLNRSNPWTQSTDTTGLEQSINAMQTNRAVCCFYALTGQFDRRGSLRVRPALRLPQDLKWNRRESSIVE
jgi:hypothetical protein